MAHFPDEDGVTEFVSSDDIYFLINPWQDAAGERYVMLTYSYGENGTDEYVLEQLPIKLSDVRHIAVAMYHAARKHEERVP